MCIPAFDKVVYKGITQLCTSTAPLLSQAFVLSIGKYTSCTAVDHINVCTKRARTVGESTCSQLQRLEWRRCNTDQTWTGGRKLGVRARDRLVRAVLAFQKRAHTQRFEETLWPQVLKMGAVQQTQYACLESSGHN